VNIAAYVRINVNGPSGRDRTGGIMTPPGYPRHGHLACGNVTRSAEIPLVESRLPPPTRIGPATRRAHAQSAFGTLTMDTADSWRRPRLT
jgi:hypothetical protein